MPILRKTILMVLVSLPSFGLLASSETKAKPEKAIAVFLPHEHGYECLFHDFGMDFTRRGGKVQLTVWAEADSKPFRKTFEKPSDLRAYAFFDQMPDLLYLLDSSLPMAALEKIQGWLEESLRTGKRDDGKPLDSREIGVRSWAYSDLAALRAKVENMDATSEATGVKKETKASTGTGKETKEVVSSSAR